jgi:hypothetical protein
MGRTGRVGVAGEMGACSYADHGGGVRRAAQEDKQGDTRLTSGPGSSVGEIPRLRRTSEADGWAPT